MAWGGAASPGGGADSSASAPGGGLGSDAFGEMPNQASRDASGMTAEEFRGAIARAMGVTAVTESAALGAEAVEAERAAIANARARGKAVRDMQAARLEAQAQQEREAMMADITAMQNTSSFATPTKAVENLNPNTDIPGPAVNTPQAALDAAVAAANTNAVSGFDNPNEWGGAVQFGFEVPETQFDDNVGLASAVSKGRLHSSYDPMAPVPQEGLRAFAPQIDSSLVDMLGTQPARATTGEEGAKNLLDDLKAGIEDGSITPNMANAIRATEDFRRAYAVVNGQSTAGKALGYLHPGFGFAAKQDLPNYSYDINKTISDIENSTNRPDSNTTKWNDYQIRMLNEQEPWSKGLNERQINFYLNNPEELEWVRNLWKQMNTYQ